MIIDKESTLNKLSANEVARRDQQLWRGVIALLKTLKNIEIRIKKLDNRAAVLAFEEVQIEIINQIMKVCWVYRNTDRIDYLADPIIEYYQHHSISVYACMNEFIKRVDEVKKERN